MSCHESSFAEQNLCWVTYSVLYSSLNRPLLNSEYSYESPKSKGGRAGEEKEGSPIWLPGNGANSKIGKEEEEEEEEEEERSQSGCRGRRGADKAKWPMLLLPLSPSFSTLPDAKMYLMEEEEEAFYCMLWPKWHVSVYLLCMFTHNTVKHYAK